MRPQGLKPLGQDCFAGQAQVGRCARDANKETGGTGRECVRRPLKNWIYGAHLVKARPKPVSPANHAFAVWRFL